MLSCNKFSLSFIFPLTYFSGVVCEVTLEKKPDCMIGAGYDALLIVTVGGSRGISQFFFIFMQFVGKLVK